MDVRILRTRWHVAHQRYWCYDCDGAIRPGSRYYGSAVIMDGNLRYIRTHVHPSDDIRCEERGSAP